jgi:hypothetical protein
VANGQGAGAFAGGAGCVGAVTDEGEVAGRVRRAVSQATIRTPIKVAMITMVTLQGDSVRLKNSRSSAKVLDDIGDEAAGGVGESVLMAPL